jgi:hypothetical protein
MADAPGERQGEDSGDAEGGLKALESGTIPKVPPRGTIEIPKVPPRGTIEASKVPPGGMGNY